MAYQFPRGTQVEVFSDEEGYRGVWFEATVLRPGGTKRNKVYVEYKSLNKTDSKDSKPLKEFVNEVNLRPRQPREKDRKFSVDEEVDAYYNDGWWEGVVTQVKDSVADRYMVYFRPSKEELEFGKDDLRVHREWVHGVWKPPMDEGTIDMNAAAEANVVIGNDGELRRKENKVSNAAAAVLTDGSPKTELRRKDNKKKKSSGKKKVQVKKTPELEAEFNDGMVVEVSSDEEGFVGAWFTGKIVKTLGKNRYLVEYDTLKTDDESELLKEEVDHLHIRPPPPEIPQAGSFRKLEEVDAFYNDAWWVGVVSKVLENSKYIVYFRECIEEIEFEHYQLRLHQDWLNKKWARSSEALGL